MHLAIIDLDGVVANSDARFARARRADGSIDWQIAFNPDLVALDTLIDGADMAIRRLEQKGYTPLFLTSRPESMRKATQAWLLQHDLDGYDLLMKPESQRYTKTTQWKADEVARLASMSPVVSALFIDDEERNQAEVEALRLPGVTVLASLAELIDDRPMIL